MVCRVRYLNSAGIHRREIAGIDRLAAAFPSNWLLYASLQAYPPREPPIEIDAMVVTDDRVIILEIKDYYGTLTHNGDQWIHNGRTQRSPVDSVAMKARKIKSFLTGRIPGFGRHWVDSRVVLTGSCTKATLSTIEQPHVWSLSEAASIAASVGKSTLLGQVRLPPKKTFLFEPELESLTRNPRMFGPLEAEWDGYRVFEDDFVIHPKKIWREHRAERVRDARYKALLRIWAFDQLPPGLNSPEMRRFVAERESRAIGLLTELGSKLIRERGILLPLGYDKDEILTQHFELREVLPNWTTLDRFIAQLQDEPSPEDRVVMVSTLLNLFSELHSQGIYHRDIGPRSIWAGGTTRMSMTGLMSCQMPGEQSIGDWASTLRGYAEIAPEDKDAAAFSTGAQRDVFAIAKLSQLLLTASVAQSDQRGSLPPQLSTLSDWLLKATEVNPSRRHANARELSDHFALLTEKALGKEIDNGLIDRHETDDNPYVLYPTSGSSLQQSSRCHVFLTTSPPDTVVKIWLGLRRGLNAAIDVALVRLFDGVSRLISSPVEGLPRFIRAGLSPVGTFVLYSHAEGKTLKSLMENNTVALEAAQVLTLAIHLLQTIEALHAAGLSHGDLSAENVLVSPSGKTVHVVDLFDLVEVGLGKVRTPSYCPPGWEALTEQQIDRYAAVLLAQKILNLTKDDRLIAMDAELQKDLDRPAVELLEPLLISLRDVLAKVTAPPVPHIALRFPAGSPDYFKSDEGRYYVRAFQRDTKTIEYAIAGLEREFVFSVVEGRVTGVVVQDASFASLAHASQHGIAVQLDIVVHRGEDSGWENLFQIIEPLGVPVVKKKDTLSGTPIIDVRRHWRNLLEFERNLFPEVEILKDLGTLGRGLAIYAYERVGQDFDFDEDATVEVRLTGGARIGQLSLEHTDDRVLAIDPQKLRRLSVGDRVVLVERRARTSYDRRDRATERILDGDAAIPGLIEYFVPSHQLTADDLGTEVSDELLATYKLNEGQRRAFRHIVRHGPVGLLQGPPGTGKTHFISAFAHWLLTIAGARKVLIASQSNEAVNNVIEKMLDLFKTTGGRRPSLLRIGSKGITERIRPFHTSALRERYQSRFDNAFKARVSSLAAAAGIQRELAEDAVEIDRNFGNRVRRLDSLQRASRSENASGAEGRRMESARRSAIFAFKNAGRPILGRDPDETAPDSELAAAFETLMSPYKASPADVTKVRHLIDLAREWSDSLASPHRNFEEFLAKTRSIVMATCVGVGQTKIRIDTQAFDWVIVDEAARCSASELAVPMQVGRRVLLVGDHRQLLPMIDRRVLKQLRDAEPSVAPDELVRSDFERAFLSPYGVHNGMKLTEQYRMADPICQLVSKIFYEPWSVKLWTSPDREISDLFKSAKRPFHQPIVWIDTSREPRNDERTPEWNRHSVFNIAEIEAVMRLLERIAGDSALVAGLHKVKEMSPIGVICMYSAQKIKIEQEFSRRPWDAAFRKLVRIETVDSYQGKENTIVILSLVRHNSRDDQGHVRRPNRCNVAVSRAKERVFTVGARDMWKRVGKTSPMRRVLEELETSSSEAVVPAGELA
jgi:serine/threonine protein kinase